MYSPQPSKNAVGPEVPPELRQVRELLADRDLEVVAGDRLVVGERLRLVARLGLRGGRVDVVAAGPRAVRRRLAVVGDRRVLLLVGTHPDHVAAAPWAGGRTSRGSPPSPGRGWRRPCRRPRRGSRSGAPGRRAAPPGRPRGTRCPGCAPPARRSPRRSGRSPRGRSGGAPPRQVERGVDADQPAVAVRPPSHVAHARPLGGTRGRQDLGHERVVEAGEGRPDLVADGVAEGLA